MFRLNATKVFLTYPQCPLSKEEALQLLQQKHPVEEYCIAQETHEDGGKHLHILLKFSRKVNYKEEDCLDLQTYHPNIQRPRSEKHVHKYCHKEDKDPLCTITQNGQVWRDALSQSTEEGFLKCSGKEHHVTTSCSMTELNLLLSISSQLRQLTNQNSQILLSLENLKSTISPPTPLVQQPSLFSHQLNMAKLNGPGPWAHTPTIWDNLTSTSLYNNVQLQSTQSSTTSTTGTSDILNHSSVDKEWLQLLENIEAQNKLNGANP